MSFPTSPVDGQIYQRYQYNLTTQSWDKYEEAGSESGSNANGSYLKLADGTMMAWGKSAPIGSDLSANAVAATTGTIYHSGASLQNFPATFIDTNTIVTYNAGQGGYPSTFYVTNVTINSFKYYQWTTKAGDGSTGGITWQAMGRWK